MRCASNFGSVVQVSASQSACLSGTICRFANVSFGNSLKSKGKSRKSAGQSAVLTESRCLFDPVVSCSNLVISTNTNVERIAHQPEKRACISFSLQIQTATAHGLSIACVLLVLSAYTHSDSGKPIDL